MNWDIIVPIIQKGLDLIITVAENPDLVLRAGTAIKNLIESPATVTQAQLDAVEADLDAMLDEFNSDLPPED